MHPLVIIKKINKINNHERHKIHEKYKKNLKKKNFLFRAFRVFRGRKNKKDISDVMTIDKLSRILIIRTDRIGDVLLSTPVIKAVRDTYPHSHIAMMVRPYTQEIVDGNPYLNEVIIYDKDGIYKSWFSSLRFALDLKKKRFDLAIILHPTTRVHIIVFLARIPQRVGYNKKFGFLLTQRLSDEKYLGKKHESDYVLDILKALDMEVKDKVFFMPIKKESEEYIEKILTDFDVRGYGGLVAVHPGASCPSKRWPPERFAQLADRIQRDYKLKVVIISSQEQEDVDVAQKVIRFMSNRPIDFSGKTTVSQLASLLKRCTLFISNDSGPVHIASVVGTPVVDIFGRNQAGLNPVRWGALGKRDVVLHKEVGCSKCFAHQCRRDFACLKAITVEDVLEAVLTILRGSGKISEH